MTYMRAVLLSPPPSLAFLASVRIPCPSGVCWLAAAEGTIQFSTVLMESGKVYGLGAAT